MAEKSRSWLKTGCLSVFGGLALIMVVGAILRPSPPAAVPAAPEFSFDCGAQAQREAFIQRLGAEGYFQKIEYRTIAEAWITPEFMALDFDTKQTFISAVAGVSFCRGNQSAVVTLSNSITGKPFGTYSPIAGLSLE